jgi:hypothetical protein
MVAPMRSAARRSAPDTASVCPRCPKRIDIGDGIRYHYDFSDAVHVGCREPSPSGPRPRKPKPALLKEIPVCSSRWTQHAGECL